MWRIYSNPDEKRTKLYTWIAESNFDIILLQETHYIEKHAIAYNARWFGKSVHCYSDSPYSRGISILFRKNLVYEILDIHRSNDGRKLLVNLKFDGKIITIVNIYAPNDTNAKCYFFKRLNLWIKKYAACQENVILAGDFNCSLDENKEDKSVNILKGLLNNLDLIDLWSKIKPSDKVYTWCNGENVATSRIDYIFISKFFCYQYDSLRLQKIPGSHSKDVRMSDHLSLQFCLRINEKLRGPGYWKFNVSLIKNQEFIT